MLRKIDIAAGIILLLGGIGHTAGTLLWLQPMSGMWIWSLGAAEAALLLGVLNILRARRGNDRALALITAVGCAVWAVVALAFGKSINNFLDPRALMHFLSAAALVVFSVMTLRKPVA